MVNEELREKNVERVLSTAFELFTAHGIEFTTMEMLIKESGLSRASISRYFTNKLDCVVRTAEWAYRGIVEKRHCDLQGLDTCGKSGIELLEDYMLQLKDDFMNNPKTFVLRSEYNSYVYRNSANSAVLAKKLIEVLDYKPALKRIYEIGVADGSLPGQMIPEEEARIFGSTYVCFLTRCAYIIDGNYKEVSDEIDTYIARAMRLNRRS